MNNENQKPITVWDKVAPLFSKVGPKYWQHFGSRLVELSTISTGAQILDIGMGRGASLFPAACKAGAEGHVTGIDISEAMVRETRREISEQNISNIGVMTMNAGHLDFPGDSFDNTLCGFGIGYILQSDSGLTEIQRVLKPGGQAGFSVWGIQEDQKWLNEIVSKYLPPASDSQNHEPKPAPPAFNTPEAMRAVLEDAGFRNISVLQETEIVVYESREQWWQEMWSNAVRTVFERIEQLGADRLEQFRAEVFAGLEAFRRPEGFCFAMPVIYAFGESS